MEKEGDKVRKNEKWRIGGKRNEEVRKLKGNRKKDKIKRNPHFKQAIPTQQLEKN